MGADFLLWALPSPDMTEERVKKLKLLVEDIPSDTLLKEMDDCCVTLNGDETDAVNEARGIVCDAIDDFADADGRRDTGSMMPNGFPCAFMFTGGMSWGDFPTDAADFFGVLGHVDEVYHQLKAWAIEDNEERRTA